MKKMISAIAVALTAMSVSTTFAQGLSELDAAHRQGWMGQDTLIGPTSRLIESYVGKVAPASDYAYDGFSFDNNAHGGLTTKTSEAYRTAIDAIPVGNSYISNINYVSVSNNLVSGGDSRIVFDASGDVSDLQEQTNARRAVFTSVADHESRGYVSQEERSAYLLGSASIMMSKYTDATAQQVVDKMDNSRTSSGAFSLQKALAPTSLK